MQVLTVGLFDGIAGALRVGAGVLKLPMEGHVSAELSKEGNRVLESNFPDSVQAADVVNIDEEAVQQFSSGSPSTAAWVYWGPEDHMVKEFQVSTQAGKGALKGTCLCM